MNSFIIVSVLILELGHICARSPSSHRRHYEEMDRTLVRDLQGVIGVKNCGTSHDVIQLKAVYMTGCAKAPCKLRINGAYSIYVEFQPYDDFANLTFAMTGIAIGIRVPVFEVSACTVLAVGQCPFVEGETYVATFDMDPGKMVPPSMEPVVRNMGRAKVALEVVTKNPEKTKNMCASLLLSIISEPRDHDDH